MASQFTEVTIGGTDRKGDVIHAQLWRTISAVGNWMAILHNVDGKYNGVFDVHDDFKLDVGGDTLMEGRVDGPSAVTLRGRDLESDWDEYIIVRGVDQGQDLMFHNDFEYSYPDGALGLPMSLHQIWNDIINTPRITTNINYAPPGASPTIPSMEFKEGSNFLASTQQLFTSGNVGGVITPWIWYVDDGLNFVDGAPGDARLGATGVTLQSIEGDWDNNILDIMDLTERDGDKHYNYIKLYGKNPMFDGYTENNATSWGSTPAGQMLDDTANAIIGGYSQVVYGNNPVNGVLEHDLVCPIFNYTGWDFSKGRIGAWGYYDNTAGAPGTPGAGTLGPRQQAGIRLVDNAGKNAYYKGTSTQLIRDQWGWISAPLGQNPNNAVANPCNPDVWWWSGGTFNWKDIREIHFMMPETCGWGTVGWASHFYIDGITIPEPCIAIHENVPAQNPVTGYRRRPYIDHWQHIRTQNTLDAVAEEFLIQHESTQINRVKIVTEGSPDLRYACQTVDVNVPSMGLTTEEMYITSLHHIVEPYNDVSDGYGFDWITEVEAVPTSGVSYDNKRLQARASRSSTQRTSSLGTGLREK